MMENQNNMIYPNTVILNKEDYIKPFTLNYDLYFKLFKVRKERGLGIREDYKEVYDHREGYYIDGTKTVPKKHPYHDMWLINKETNVKYHIDMVSVNHQYGKYLTLVTRKDGSESHGMVFFENILCHDPIILDSIRENKKKFKLVQK